MNSSIFRACPHCGSTSVRPKGYVPRKSGRTGRLLRCVECGHRFVEEPFRRWMVSDLPDDLVRRRLTHSLNELLSEGLRASRSTIYRETLRRLGELNSLYCWENRLWDARIRGTWGLIMGLDTTEVKVLGRPYTYLHVVDIPSTISLAYEILSSKRSTDIERVLSQICLAGYNPKIAVTDLAPELLEALQKVFPRALIQGCLFHLKYWLDKELPTERKRLSPDVRSKWIAVKEKIMAVAVTRTSEQRKKLLDELLRLRDDYDETTKRVVDLFLLERRNYYHVMEDLERMGCTRKQMYNNVCEGQIREVKELEHRMRGFKSIENAKKYINALWFYKN